LTLKDSTRVKKDNICPQHCSKEEVDQYGNNGFIVESITKEEREQGKKGTIIGNAKFMVAGGPSKQEEPQDLPF